jgi:hypothetical protein
LFRCSSLGTKEYIKVSNNENSTDTLEDPIDTLEDPDEKQIEIKTGGNDSIEVHDDSKIIIGPTKLIEAIKEKKDFECSVHNPKGNTNVCSPPEIIHIMAKFAEQKNTKTGSQSDKSQSDKSQSNSTSKERFKTAVKKIITSTKVINDLKKLLNCESESCIIKNTEFRDFAKRAGFSQSFDDILHEFFKPEGPAKNFGLLNNINIDNFLNQLEKKFPTFLHIPYQMRDFEKQRTALATVDLATAFEKGKRTFGVVLNTDYTVGPGIHWFCLFGEYNEQNKKITIEYFNSSGESPLEEVQAWIQTTKYKLMDKMNLPEKNIEIKYSTGIRLQNDNHSCGVYCLMYIWLRLEGQPFEYFNRSNINDALMHNSRAAVFTAG